MNEPGRSLAEVLPPLQTPVTKSLGEIMKTAPFGSRGEVDSKKTGCGSLAILSSANLLGLISGTAARPLDGALPPAKASWRVLGVVLLPRRGEELPLPPLRLRSAALGLPPGCCSAPTERS